MAYFQEQLANIASDVVKLGVNQLAHSWGMHC